MSNLEHILSIIFKKVSAEEILKGNINGRKFEQIDFTRIAVSYEHYYSESELDNMWSFYKDSFLAERKYYDEISNTREDSFRVFDALLYFVRRMLLVEGNEIVCNYNKIQEWRRLTLELSEDLLVCAYCAGIKTPENMENLGFSWKIVIGHNNVQLNRILERGISENHFHLYGSAPIFHLSWLNLMNQVLENKLTNTLNEYDIERRNRKINYGLSSIEASLTIQHYQAAFIRIILFAKIMGKRIQLRNQNRPLVDENLNIDGEAVLHILTDKYSLESNLSELQNIIIALRNVFSGENGPGELVDYALQGVKDSYEDYNDIFCGERWLLYSCLYKIYKEELNEIEENLVYAYIVLKENIRAELVQANKDVGFVNFQKYQKRKLSLIENTIFKKEVVRSAVRENLLNENINLIELRIVPEMTAEKLLEQILKLDAIIGEPKSKYFYVLHFLKSKEKEDDLKDYLKCRHFELRNRLRKVVHAIIGLRQEYPETASRIRGIDAAGKEIGCRPEVFASGFRYLRNHVKMLENGRKREYVPQLKITYHVGEDFLDVADGLRAIDEAVNFLNMNCGDRLGHAIALGIDVEEWYASKGYKVLLPMQDYLDNLVWVFYSLIRFDIQGMDSVKDYIQKKYNQYFYEIYGKYIDFEFIKAILRNAEKAYINVPEFMNPKNNTCYFDMSQYYNAWKLRGDNPLLYSHGYFKWNDNGTNEKKAEVNSAFPKQFEIRYIPAVFLLNYYYHFSPEVKKAGNKKIEVKIRPNYIKAVMAIQKEMQKRIGYKGISIETNPSSNFSISTFKDYAKHPIFNFYNKNLTYDKDELEKCAQLSVSVNTDDQGIFATSLENEYALLASALEQKRDEDGKHVYNKAMIYEWIDEVRQMGNEQSFGELKKISKERNQENKDAWIYHSFDGSEDDY